MDIYKSIQSYHVCTCYTHMYIYIYDVYTRHITEKCCHFGQRALLHVLVIQFLSTTERWRFEVTTERSATIHGWYLHGFWSAIASSLYPFKIPMIPLFLFSYVWTVLLNQCDFNQDLRIIQSPRNEWHFPYHGPTARIWRQNRNLKRTITWPWPSLEKSMKANGLGQLTCAFCEAGFCPDSTAFVFFFFLWGLFDVFLAFGRKSGLFC